MKYFLRLVKYIEISIYLCMAKKKKSGGRNPVEPAEKVILVGFYTKQRFVDQVGGMASARKIAKDHLENQPN